MAEGQTVPEDVSAERREIARTVGGQTLGSVFLRTVERQASEVALRHRVGADWVETTWTGYADRAARMAAGLSDLGVQRGDRVAMLLRNRPEFHVTEMGTLLAGATPVSIYNSSPPSQITYFLNHCAAPVIVCENEEWAARVDSVRDQLPNLKHVVIAGASPSIGAVTVEDLLAADAVDLEAAVAAIHPEDLATIIYTSGTTGRPKGVMISHANVVFNAESFARAGRLDLRGMRSISYLPMAHIGERFVTHYLHLRFGTEVSTCEDITRINEYLLDVRPAWWFCAPRMWEKLHSAMAASVAGSAGLALTFHAAQEVGARYFEATKGGRQAPQDLRSEWQDVRSEVIAPVLAEYGLDQIEVAISGSAPMPRQTFEFFTRCGLPLSDVYGQSESSGFISWDPVRVVPGTSGRRFPGTELRIAADGEICTRGPNVFIGYLDAPDQTAEVIDAEGWLHTGDLGEIDAAGNLRVVGRKKEILVPTSGHNVAPVGIEATLKEHPLIGQACLIGDSRPHITALLVLDPEGLRSWAGARTDLDLSSTPYLPVAAGQPAVIAEIEAHVERTNSGLARPEQIRAFRVLSDEWLPDTDVMTPTAKIKRAGVAARYAAVIDELYLADSAAAPDQAGR